MSFFESEDCANSEVAYDELTADELNGLVQLPGSVVFADLVEPAEVMKSVRYGITFRVPKDAVIPGRHAEDGTELTFGGVLFGTAQRIAEKVWGAESPNIDAVWSALDAGINRKSSPFGVQDGDLSEYPNDHNHWVVKASRAENKGRPSLYDRKGGAIYEATNEDDEGDVINGELIGDPNEVASFGDLVMVLCRIWAMDDYDRLNIEVVGVKTVAKGKGGGGRAAAIAAENASLNTLASGDLAMPANLALPAGPEADDEEEEEAPPKKKAAKKAAKKKAAKKSAPKKAAKKKAAKKKGGKSVFRK